jgi:hypothetical protein
MTYHIFKSEIIGNISFRSLCMVFVFVFMLFILYPMLPGWDEANAQDNDDTRADFLFQKPKKYVGIRVGLFCPEADSELFNMITEELTLEKKDFRGLDLGVDLGFSLHKRFDLVLSLDSSTKTNNSEFRDYVDEEGLPITQSTKFSQVPLTAGIKFLIIPRGREIGQYSWLPSPIVPYVSGGGGILWYEFRQHGDFVDYSTLDIFSATLDSSGGVFTVYQGCGTEINIFKTINLNLDLRYYWADADLDSDFAGFDPIELGGYRITAGIQWHF